MAMAMAMPISLHGPATPGTITARSTPLFKPTSPPPPPPLTTTSSRRSSHVASARKGLSSRTRRSERPKKGDVTATTTTTIKEEEMAAVDYGGGGGELVEYSKEPMPKLEGLEPNFWEGPQWDTLGFFVQYMWAFGILFGLVACGIAVATYNEGATDFKQTTVYKESIQSRELLEEPDASNSDVFETNPTEVAPSLE